MALQTQTYSVGSFDRYEGTSNGYILDLILTEEATDQLANTSLISYKLQLRSGPSNRFNGYLRAEVILGGKSVAVEEMATISAAYNKTYLLLSGTETVTHDNDGSFTLSASGSAKMLGETISNPYAPPDMTATGDMALTTIPRASTLAATSVFIGDASTIAVGRKSPSYVHSIRYQFGSISGYIADAAGTHSDTEVKLTDTALLFPVPESFYGEIPNAPSAPCTLTCITYSGDLQIGNPQTATFTITADPARCGPLVTGSVADVNEDTLALTGDSYVLVQGVSEAGCIVEAQARHSAVISALYINGVPIESSPYVLDTVTTSAITYRAVDSRGYSAEYTVPGLSLIPYVPLSFHTSASRTDPTSGNAVLSVRGKWYNGSFGAVNNALTAEIRVDYGTGTPFALSVAGGDFSAEVPLSGLDYRAGHTIEVVVSDAIYPHTKTATISKGIPVFDWGENDFSFHVPVRFVATDGTEFTLDLIDGQLVAVL